ncbi:uncharacterized protein [Procambarus clarkii]|uniref:uncharacterized protein n=1 Tax=Procambarus clarkii TaxID=6728 RepID=UPI00374265F1
MAYAGGEGAAKPQYNIREDHVKEALKADKGSEAVLNFWQIKDLAEKGDNFSSSVTSVKVRFSLMGETSKVSYVVKICPPRSKMAQVAEFPLKMMKKENEFFQEILPKLNSELTSLGHHNLRMPKWFYTSLEENREMIFLEDLRDLGFEVFKDCKVGLDEAHTKLVLQELARLHAASLLLKAKMQILHEEPDSEKGLALAFKYINEDWTTLKEDEEAEQNSKCSVSLVEAEAFLAKDGGCEVARRWLDMHKNKPLDLVKSFLVRQTKFDVICHGDCWVNNLQFRYNKDGEPVEVMLLDLQLNRLASPATDINYLLYTSLHGDNRKTNWRNYLSSYYNTFRGVMESGGLGMLFTLEELHQEYRSKMEYGMLYGSMTVALLMRESPSSPGWMGGSKNFQTRFLALYGELIEQER